jgi:hypothetical protein
MERMQLCLTEAQKNALLGLSRESAVSIAALARAAIDDYLARNADDEWERAVNATFGTMPELPDGETYERSLRAAWGERLPAGHLQSLSLPDDRHRDPRPLGGVAPCLCPCEWLFWLSRSL